MKKICNKIFVVILSFFTLTILLNVNSYADSNYTPIGIIEIPSINIKCSVVSRVTTDSLEKGVAFLYGHGLNQVGNTVLVGHNYKNGLFFSNIKNLNEGDIIYITDNNNSREEYTVYKKFETTENDTSFYERETNGKKEITLSSVTDNGSGRLIIEAVSTGNVTTGEFDGNMIEVEEEGMPQTTSTPTPSNTGIFNTETISPTSTPTTQPTVQPTTQPITSTNNKNTVTTKDNTNLPDAGKSYIIIFLIIISSILSVRFYLKKKHCEE